MIAIIKGVSVIVKRAQSIKDATAEEKEAAKAAVIDNLRQVIFGWVTDAERELGEKTGKLKSAKVAGWIYENIPDDLKPLFTSQEIQDMIDDVLHDAQAYWDKNSKAREYIESGATTLLTATAEIGAVNMADGVPVEEIAKAVGEHVSAAIMDAMETAQSARGAAEDKRAHRRRHPRHSGPGTGPGGQKRRARQRRGKLTLDYQPAFKYTGRGKGV